MAPGRPCWGRAGDVQACITRHHSPCLLLPTGQQSPREKHSSHPVLCAVTRQAILKASSKASVRRNMSWMLPQCLLLREL